MLCESCIIYFLYASTEDTIHIRSWEDFLYFRLVGFEDIQSIDIRTLCHIEREFRVECQRKEEENEQKCRHGNKWYCDRNGRCEWSHERTKSVKEGESTLSERFRTSEYESIEELEEYWKESEYHDASDDYHECEEKISENDGDDDKSDGEADDSGGINETS